MLNYWEDAAVVETFANKRQSWWDFYDSERKIFAMLPPVSSILDFGCGTGGALGAISVVASSYCGVDSSAAMRAEGKARHPAAQFVPAIPPGHHADLVLSLGTLHVCQNWRDLLWTLWEAADRFLVFDLRLGRPDVSGHRGALNVPYVTVAIEDVFGILNRWKSKAITLYGYDRPANRDGEGLRFMGVFLVEK